MGDNATAGPLVVIGGGPGGYAAAFAAADRGIRTILVDDGQQLGGVCLPRGCIPSKALLHVARLVQEAGEARGLGLDFGGLKVDLPRLRSWKNDVIAKLTGGISELCKRRGIEWKKARASFIDSQSLRLEPSDGSAPEQLAFDKAIIATGSSPARPAALASDDPRVMDSTAALELADIPPRLLVIGGGYIGLELGSAYAAIGSKVTIVELTDGLLPGVDRDLVRPLQKRLEGVVESIHLGTKVLALSPGADGVRVMLDGQNVPKEMTFDKVLVAVGRKPNSSGLGLENTRVVVGPRGFIEVDSQMRTADPAILAIGDVTGEPMLAHKATRQGVVAAEVLAGEPAGFDNAAIPAVVFTDPEIAWCGLTENEAKAKNIEFVAHRFPWAASGRAQTLARTEGMTKLLFDPKSERILGMGIVGPGAGELIAEGVLAIEMGAVARDVADSIHPHPTISETVMESAESFFGHATHLFRPKR